MKSFSHTDLGVERRKAKKLLGVRCGHHLPSSKFIAFTDFLSIRALWRENIASACLVVVVSDLLSDP